MQRSSSWQDEVETWRVADIKRADGRKRVEKNPRTRKGVAKAPPRTRGRNRQQTNEKRLLVQLKSEASNTTATKQYIVPGWAGQSEVYLPSGPGTWHDRHYRTHSLGISSHIQLATALKGSTIGRTTRGPPTIGSAVCAAFIALSGLAPYVYWYQVYHVLTRYWCMLAGDTQARVLWFSGCSSVNSTGVHGAETRTNAYLRAPPPGLDIRRTAMVEHGR